MPGSGQGFMYFVGVVEIIAGIVVLLKPRYGGGLARWHRRQPAQLSRLVRHRRAGLRPDARGAHARALASHYDPPLRLRRLTT